MMIQLLHKYIVLEQSTLLSTTDWLKHTADLGTYIYLLGALLQYVIIRLNAGTSIPQTLTLLIISRCISIILAWTIFMFYSKSYPYIISDFIFIPAVMSETFIALFSYIVIKKMIKK